MILSDDELREWSRESGASEYQIKQIESAVTDKLLRIVYEQTNAYGKPGECIWLGVKAQLRKGAAP